MATQDPLLLLRSCLSTGSTITLLTTTPSDPPSSTPTEEVYSIPLSTHIAFPTSSSSSLPPPIFPKSIPTRYLATTDPTSTETFDLQTLLLVFLQRDASTAEYMKIVREGNLGFVSAIDRKVVVDWLSGKSPLEGPPGRILPLAGTGKRAADVLQVEGTEGDKVGASPVKKQRYAPDAGDQVKVKRLMAIIQGPAYGYMVEGKVEKAERKGGVIKDRQTVLRGERVNNFDSARALVQPRLKLQREEQHRLTSGAVLAPSSNVPAPISKPKKKNLNPIIIISPSSTALITMHNVKRFLEDSVFEPSDEARVSSLPGGNGAVTGKSAEDMIVVNHLRTTASVSQTGVEPRKGRYIIVDGVEALSKFGGLDEAWERVVCVMTTGQEWQFRPYKWTEPKELFHHVKGVFVQWTNDPPNTKVRGWNVTELRIDPTKRHIDKSTVADFWRGLESYIAMHKPWLSV